MTLKLFYLNLKLKEVFIKTTDSHNNESTIYGGFEDETGNRILKPLQVINYVGDDFLTIPEAIKAFKFWDNKKGKTYSEINVILEGLEACNNSMYGFIIKKLMKQIEELDSYIEAENNVNKVLPSDKCYLRIEQLREAIKKLEETIIILAEEP